MKILYQKEKDGILILRCFGWQGLVELPSRIEDMPVVAIGPYAFSDREDIKEVACLYEEKASIEDEEFSQKELTGERVEEIIFPSTLKRVGKYAFYGCRNLKRLRFSNNFTDIGQGAFTGCRGLSLLEIDCKKDFSSSLGEVLGHLSGEIRVRFFGEENKSELMLFFPEIYEDAAENTPARIISTHYYGSGESFRQCFYDKQIDFKKYDSLFYMAKAVEKIETIIELASYRLIYPIGLVEKAKEEYIVYFREKAKEVLAYAIAKDWQELLLLYSSHRLYTKDNLDFCIEEVFRQEKNWLLSFFMEEKEKLEEEFLPSLEKRKRFRL